MPAKRRYLSPKDMAGVPAIEVWRPFPGGHGRYEVSNFGDVRSIGWQVTVAHRWGKTSIRTNKPRPIRPNSNGSGYLTVMLRVEGCSKRFYVHRAVLEAFVGPPPSGRHQAAHWDGVRSNNALANLRWALPVENAADRVRHGTHLTNRPKRTHCPQGHPYSGDNLRMSAKGYRVCITCSRAACRANYYKAKGANAA
jgi:hypothetical protein